MNSLLEPHVSCHVCKPSIGLMQSVSERLHNVDLASIGTLATGESVWNSPDFVRAVGCGGLF